MNPYLLFLSLYTLCIFPLTLKFELRLGEKLSYHFRLRLVGVKPLRKPMGQKDENGEAAFQSDPQASLAQLNPVLIRCLFSRNLWHLFWRSVQCQKLLIRVRVAFQDAAATGLAYGMVIALMDMLRHMSRRDIPLQLDAEAGFSGEGGEILIQGIFLVRLGSLAVTASRFLAVYQKVRGKLRTEEPAPMEEEEHATASHR